MTDAELLEHFYADKNQEWIGILLQRYTLLLLGVCMKYLKNETDAQDCVQQIFLKVLTEVSKYRIEYFKSWLYSVAKNHCLMKLREKSSKNVQELKDQEVAQHSEPDDALVNEQNLALLEQALAALNDEQRQCVTLFYLKKMSYQQVAEATGYTLLQVKSFIQNGKRNLKINLSKKLKEKETPGK